MCTRYSGSGFGEPPVDEVGDAAPGEKAGSDGGRFKGGRLSVNRITAS